MKAHSQQEFARLDSSIESNISSLETRITEFQENLARNSV